MLETKQVDFLFADARTLYDDALEMLDQGRLRNAAEKAWCAAKLATDALILAHHRDGAANLRPDCAHAPATAEAGPFPGTD